MVKFTPLEPPAGIGRDLPDEAGAEGYDPELMQPSPRLVTEGERYVEYPYNKVTKYLNGHKIEFNTTEGGEYINIEHGDGLARVSLFKDGRVEIIHGGNFLHRATNDGNSQKSEGSYSVYATDSFIQNWSQDRYIQVFESESHTNNTFELKSKEKAAIQTPELEVAADKVIIDGEVQINGDVTILGNLTLSGELLSNIAKVERKLVRTLDRFDRELESLLQKDLQSDVIPTSLAEFEKTFNEDLA